MEIGLNKRFPKDVKSFYIELYCKRKRKTHKQCFIEASKSWALLSKSEKKVFETKYNEYRLNLIKSTAMRLTQAEPYMKPKKGTKRCLLNANSNNEETNKESLEMNIQNPDNEIRQQELITSQIEVENNQNSENICVNIPYEENMESNNSYHGSPIPMDTEMVPIREPIPPKVKTGKELFMLVREREKYLLQWSHLPQTEKYHYTKAVTAIKKNYLQEYKTYLEHLPSEELFYHYRNIIESEELINESF